MKRTDRSERTDIGYAIRRKIASALPPTGVRALLRLQGWEMVARSCRWPGSSVSLFPGRSRIESPLRPTSRVSGGDFHDVIRLPNGLLAFILGDVAGKGNAVTRSAWEVRQLVWALLLDCPEPASALTRLNSILYRAQASDLFAPLGVSLTLLVAYPALPEEGISPELCWAQAGMLPPTFLSHHRFQEGMTSHRDQIEGTFPLGLVEDASYPLKRASLCRDVLIVLASDGVTEARCPDTGCFFGDDGLVAEAGDSIGALGPLGDHLFDRARQHAGGMFQDDATLVLLRYHGLPDTSRSPYVSQ